MATKQESCFFHAQNKENRVKVSVSSQVKINHFGKSNFQRIIHDWKWWKGGGKCKEKLKTEVLHCVFTESGAEHDRIKCGNSQSNWQDEIPSSVYT